MKIDVFLLVDKMLKKLLLKKSSFFAYLSDGVLEHLRPFESAIIVNRTKRLTVVYIMFIIMLCI